MDDDILPSGAPAPDRPAPTLAPISGATAPRRRRGGLVAVALVTVVVVVGAAIGGYVWLRRDAEAAWDPVVAPLVPIVEAHRGLRFEHPVEVAYLDDEAFRAELRAGVDSITDEDLAEIEQWLAALRALGLAQGETDLEQIVEGTAAGIAAFYDPEVKRIVVPAEYRDGELDPFQRSVLVHELTHALQDQHFDLQAVLASDDEHETIAGDTLVEGDATVVQDLYVRDLRAQEFEAYADAQLAAATAAEAALAEIALPPAFTLILSAPYLVGPALAWMLRGEAGIERLDAAFSSPPTTDRDALDPYAYVFGDPADLEVTAPTAPADATAVSTGVFGSFSLLATLNGYHDPKTVISLAEQWGADEYVLYDQAGRTCIDVALRGRTDDATAALATALHEWADATAIGATVLDATAPDGGRQVDVHSCDPGPTSPLVPPPVDDLTTVLAFRSQLFASMMDDTVPSDQAWCIVTSLVDALPTADILVLATITGEEPEHAELMGRVTTAVTSAQAGCLANTTAR